MLFIFLLGSCDGNNSESLAVDMKPDRSTKVNLTISNNGSSDLLFFDFDTPIHGHYRQ